LPHDRLALLSDPVEIGPEVGRRPGLARLLDLFREKDADPLALVLVGPGRVEVHAHDRGWCPGDPGQRSDARAKLRVGRDDHRHACSRGARKRMTDGAALRSTCSATLPRTSRPSPFARVVDITILSAPIASL